ncbi:helix-turn-helix transcriptional regulator, partial [Candidatus Saccharibacteria bacterium]|nr:helix-turn-helix transcriptional regulator [Candidatus Saccharibacteria bacterium]NIV03096.1 TetR family transcriptional regulator [Calditrichia bacterium]NIW79848.1 TetR family transcriptional regulator [Calditrichia bacterium]
MSPRTEEQLSAIREKTRASILESALELFATKGFHGTSIGEIAKKAEISKGLAYHYFDSKQDILEAVI